MRAILIAAALTLAAAPALASEEMICMRIVDGLTRCQKLTLEDQAAMAGVTPRRYDDMRRIGEAGGGNQDGFMGHAMMMARSAQAEADRINRSRSRLNESYRNGGVNVIRGGQ